MVSARIACIVVPLFPLAARLRSEPGLAGAAVAVFEGNGNAARVVAATKPARRAGIQAGHTLPQARALLPDLLARGRDRESERAAQEALTEIADGFSPRVESAQEGVVYFDAAGIPMPSPSVAPHPGPLPERGEGEDAPHPGPLPGGERGKGGAGPLMSVSTVAARLLLPSGEKVAKAG
jgi:impB/mucB/samB family protein